MPNSSSVAISTSPGQRQGNRFGTEVRPDLIPDGLGLCDAVDEDDYRIDAICAWVVPGASLRW
jgi:hypothetical protein